MNSKIEELDDNDNDYSKDLTLKKLFLWTSEPIERMKWLACSCDIVSSKDNNITKVFKFSSRNN
jgi:hypothetical protein